MYFVRLQKAWATLIHCDGRSGWKTLETDGKSRKAQCAEDLRRKVPDRAVEPGSYLDEVDLSEAYGISARPCARCCASLRARATSSCMRTGAPRSRRWPAQDAAQLLRRGADDLCRHHPACGRTCDARAGREAEGMPMGLPPGDPQRRCGRPRAWKRAVSFDHRRDGGQRIPDPLAPAGC